MQGPSSRWRQQNEGAARSALPLEWGDEQVETNQGLDRMEVLTEHTDRGKHRCTPAFQLLCAERLLWVFLFCIYLLYFM